MPGRLDPLFPDCCYRCDHHESPAGTCDHEFDQLLRHEFSTDPDQPCPVGNWDQ